MRIGSPRLFSATNHGTTGNCTTGKPDDPTITGDHLHHGFVADSSRALHLIPVGSSFKRSRDRSTGTRFAKRNHWLVKSVATAIA